MYLLNTQHILFTRFNFPTNGEENIIGDWPDYRLKLFKQICLPSILNQKDANFTWIILVNKDSSHKVISFFDDLSERYTFIKIQYKSMDNYFSDAKRYEDEDEETHMERRQNILKCMWEDITLPYIEKYINYIITTRLDSDDAIHYNYINKIQNSKCSKYSQYIINCPHGVVRNYGKMEGVYKESNYNAFSSVLSYIKRKDDKLIYRHIHGYGTHRSAHQSLPLVEIETEKQEPMWAITSHSKNILGYELPEDEKIYDLKKYFNIEK